VIDIAEFTRAMGEFGVPGPTRQSLLWLAERINEHSRRESERNDARINYAGRLARGIFYK
jgi:hypothetical protein